MTGKWETAAPIRAFVPYDDGASILATYTCTPVVHFSLADLLDPARSKRGLAGHRASGSPLRAGQPVRLVVDPVLEDLAGNSALRVFDRDLGRPADDPGPAL